MFPLFLDLRERLCLVVGGGPVGRRKAAALLEGGARVRMVCLEPCPPDLVHDRIDWCQEPYRPEHLRDAVLVFAAASTEVNRRVSADARVAGLWVNNATEPENGDFFVPATCRRGELLIAIGTGGTAPALAATVRNLLETAFDETFDHWLALLAEVRTLARETVPEATARQELMRRLCRWEWLERLRREGIDPVRTSMFAEIQTLAGPAEELL
jgi:precorrin-2 dehydrogenase/sirohydrochlorin ferrochelatase